MTSYIEQFRLALFLNQAELADYLEIKRSTFSMAEKKERILPHDQHLWLLTLIKNQPTEEQLPPAKDFINKYLADDDKLKKRQEENRYQLILAERKLAELYKTARCYQTQLATLAKTYQSNEINTSHQQQWLLKQMELLETTHIPMLAREIKLLEVRVQGLKAELAELG